jgi:RNA-directed DNA polymerase
MAASYGGAARGLNRRSDIIQPQRSFATKALPQPAQRFDPLSRLMCPQEGSWAAVPGGLANKGARPPGIDGGTQEARTSEPAPRACVQASAQALRDRRFRPSPGRRGDMPKRNGQQRPLGIATLTDRVVQRRRHMGLAPMWESDFLNGAKGFRPGRSTMAGIALLDSSLHERRKDFGVIAGASRAACASGQQTPWLPLLAQRVADHRLLALLDSVRNAGLRHGTRLPRTATGSAHGAIGAPLWANLYGHRGDLYGWQHAGSRAWTAKERRRQAHPGPWALIRDAEAGLLRPNGSQHAAYRLREEVQTFLREVRSRELAVETTHSTPVHDGFDCLGFHVRRSGSDHDRPTMWVRPSDKAHQRLNATSQARTARRRVRDGPLLTFRALKAVLRGWGPS